MIYICHLALTQTAHRAYLICLSVTTQQHVILIYWCLHWRCGLHDSGTQISVTHHVLPPADKGERVRLC